MLDISDSKQMAKTLRKFLGESGVEISHSAALEIVSRQFGYDSWNILSARIERADAERGTGVAIQPAIPIFRIFDVDKSMEFYRDFLGFTVDWEHRFGSNFPLYCQISRSSMLMHLSEHSGDASPGARVFVPVERLEAYHAELTAKDYRYMKPGLEKAPWGLELQVTDPFGNRITFCERQTSR